jgi:myo-inositol-1(or 4)-monophosphatase
VMVQCAGLRRPGAASLDLCYVAAGMYDGFFETGLNPWDIAAGSLIITEAGGLVGNFTGEPDFLYQREIVAGAPRIYGQLVKTLSPYSRVIADAAAAEQERAASSDEYEEESDPEDDALIATLQAAEDAAQADKVAESEQPKRTRITAAAKAAEVQDEARNERPAPRRNRDDAPF